MDSKRDLETIEAWGLILDKAKTTLDCVIDHSRCPRRVETLAFITNDYLCELGRAMQIAED